MSRVDCVWQGPLAGKLQTIKGRQIGRLLLVRDKNIVLNLREQPVSVDNRFLS